MNPNAYHQPRMLSLGRRGKFGSLGRNKVIPKVLFLSLLAYFAYNSFDNSSVEIYRQLYEAAGDAPSESSGKVARKLELLYFTANFANNNCQKWHILFLGIA